MFIKRIVGGLVCLLAASAGLAPTLAQDAGKGASGFREIDLKGLNLAPVPAVASWNKPTKITSAQELAKAFPDKEAQVKIAKQVDFIKDYLLYFRWTGSGGD